MNRVSFLAVFLAYAVLMGLLLSQSQAWMFHHAYWLWLIPAVPFILHFRVSARKGPPALSKGQFFVSVLFILLGLILSLSLILMYLGFEDDLRKDLVTLSFTAPLASIMLIVVLAGRKAWKRFKAENYLLIACLAATVLAVISFVDASSSIFSHRFVDLYHTVHPLKKLLGISEPFFTMNQYLPNSEPFFAFLLYFFVALSFLFITLQARAILLGLQDELRGKRPYFAVEVTWVDGKAVKRDRLKEELARLKTREYSPISSILALFPTRFHLTQPPVAAYFLALKKSMLEKWEKRQAHFHAIIEKRETTVCTTCIRRPEVKTMDINRVPVCPVCKKSANLLMGVTEIHAWLSDRPAPKNSSTEFWVPVKTTAHLPKYDYNQLYIGHFEEGNIDMSIAKFVHEYLEIFPQGKLAIELGKGIAFSENSRRLLDKISLNR